MKPSTLPIDSKLRGAICQVATSAI